MDGSPDTEDLANILHDIVEHDAGLEMSKIVASIRDAVNLNGSVLRELRVHLKKAVDVACFSHMFNRVGEFFHGPLLAFSWATSLSISATLDLYELIQFSLSLL